MPAPGLCDNTGVLIRRVRGGGRVDVEVDGLPAVGPVPADDTPRRWLPRAELIRRLRTSAADPGPRDDLEHLAGETTDDLPLLA